MTGATNFLPHTPSSFAPILLPPRKTFLLIQISYFFICSVSWGKF
jgi:hypothetical protein